MEEEKDQVFNEIEEQVTEKNSELVGETAEIETAENKGNNWILWVMGVVLIALIAFLVFYIVGKPSGKSGDDVNVPADNSPSISIEAGETLAKVADRELTDGEVTERAIRILAQSQQMTPEQLDLEDPQIVGQIAQAKNYALGQMVQEIIFEEYAKKEGIQLSDDDIAQTAFLTIDSQIKPYVSGKDVSKWDENDQEQWETWLASQGFGSDDDLKNDFVMRYPAELTTDTYKRMLYGEELDSIKVSETEARSWFEAPGRIRIAHILYSFNPESDPKELEKEARENAEKARLTALSDSDFLSLAFDVSEDPTAKQNHGDLGWYTISNGALVSDQGGQFVTEFEQAALRLRLGEISPVVQTQFGFHVIKIIDADANGTRYDLPEGIRLATINILNSAEPDEDGEMPVNPKVRADEALKKILSGELDFVEAVSLYSDDQITKSNGGEMPSFMASDSSGFFWASLDIATELDGQGMYPYEKAVIEKLWTIDDGEVYPEVIQVENGWVIGKVIMHRDESIAVFSDIKEQVVSDRTNELKAEFENKWMEKAREELNVEYMTQPNGFGTQTETVIP